MFIGNIDENNFIQVHNAILCRTHHMTGAISILQQGLLENDREKFNDGLKKLGDFLDEADKIFNTMWNLSNPK